MQNISNLTIKISFDTQNKLFRNEMTQFSISLNVKFYFLVQPKFFDKTLLYETYIFAIQKL